MRNLAGTIEDALADRRQTKTDFCAALGVSRTTLTRWQTSIPQPNTLRRIAQYLDLPYRTVVAAALTGAGYLRDDDSLTPPSIHVVVNECPPDEDPIYIDADLPGHGVVGAFTDPHDADRYANNANQVSPRGHTFTTQHLDLDTTTALEVVDVYTTRWDHTLDVIRTTESHHARVPDRLRSTRTTSVNAAEYDTSGLIEELLVDSLDPHSGELIMEAFLETLRDHARLLPSTPNVATDHPSPQSRAVEPSAQRSDSALSVDDSVTHSQSNCTSSRRYSAHTAHDLIDQLERRARDRINEGS